MHHKSQKELADALQKGELAAALKIAGYLPTAAVEETVKAVGVINPGSFTAFLTGGRSYQDYLHTIKGGRLCHICGQEPGTIKIRNKRICATCEEAVIELPKGENNGQG